METALILLTVGLAQAVAVISPGPSFLIVARTAVAESRRAGAITAIGLGVGTVIWAAAALFGLSSLFELAPWTYWTAKILGGAYLVYLAIQLWRHAATPLPSLAEMPERRGAALRQGLLTQLANPKVAIFFGSIFLTLLPPQPSATMIALLLPLTFIIEVSWYVAVACLLSDRRLREGYRRAKAWIDRLTGSFLGVLGLRLITER